MRSKCCENHKEISCQLGVRSLSAARILADKPNWFPRLVGPAAASVSVFSDWRGRRRRIPFGPSLDFAALSPSGASSQPWPCVVGCVLGAASGSLFLLEASEAKAQVPCASRSSGPCLGLGLGSFARAPVSASPPGRLCFRWALASWHREDCFATSSRAALHLSSPSKVDASCHGCGLLCSTSRARFCQDPCRLFHCPVLLC